MKYSVLLLIITLSSLAVNAQKKMGFLIMDETYLIVNKTNVKLETWNVIIANKILKAVNEDGKIRLKKFTADATRKGGTLYDLYFSHDDFYRLQEIIKEIDSATRVNH